MNRIKELRLSSNFSGIEVAKMLNITPQYYYDIERGERRLSSDIASRLADIFGVTVDRILGRMKELETKSTEIDLEDLQAENARLREQVHFLKEAIKNLTKGW